MPFRSSERGKPITSTSNRSYSSPSFPFAAGIMRHTAYATRSKRACERLGNHRCPVRDDQDIPGSFVHSRLRLPEIAERASHAVAGIRLVGIAFEGGDPHCRSGFSDRVGPRIPKRTRFFRIQSPPPFGGKTPVLRCLDRSGSGCETRRGVSGRDRGCPVRKRWLAGPKFRRRRFFPFFRYHPRRYPIPRPDGFLGILDVFRSLSCPCRCVNTGSSSCSSSSR